MVCQNPSDSGPSADTSASDFLAFLLIILFARQSRVPGLKFSSLLDTIAKDATWYFLVIFTSHLVLVITLSLGRVSLIMSLPDRAKLQPSRAHPDIYPVSPGHVSCLRPAQDKTILTACFLVAAARGIIV